MDNNILLLTSESSNMSWVEVIIVYAVLFSLIVISLILLAFIKRSFKKEQTFKTIKSKCEKAKNYALKIKNKTSKQDLLIASAKLNRLTSLIGEATWVITITAEERKDVILDDIASSIDNLASYVGEYSSEGFYDKNDYRKKIDYVIQTLDGIKSRVEQYQKDTSNKKR